VSVRRLPVLVLCAVLCGVLCTALSACGLVHAGAEGAGDAMLGAADLYGARPTEVSGAHPPLVPAPCPDEPFRSDDDRLDTRAITASVAPGSGDRRFQVYEYVAGYRPGGAQAYLDELAERLGRCQNEEDHYSLVARDIGVPGTMLVQHDHQEDGTETTGLLRRCGELGCHPAPTGCTSDSYVQAARDADAPEHSYHRERGCDRKWLVMDISINGGPVCEEPGDCAGASRTTRYFYRATPTGWRVIAATTKPGCDDVLAAEPRFPRELCATLTAP